MNRTNINPQLLAIEAAVTKKKDYIYQAAMLDPHTAAELTIDQIVSMCDDLIEAHKGWLPEYHYKSHKNPPWGIALFPAAGFILSTRQFCVRGLFVGQKSVGVRSGFELVDFSDGEPRDAGNQVGG